MKQLLLMLAICVAAGGANAKQPSKTKPKPGSEQAASMPGDPNGSWTVEATTTVGECPTLIPPSLEIADNRIAPTQGAQLSSWGYVDQEGSIVARFTGSGERVVRLHGTMRGGQASGAWSSSTDMCGGVWRASRSREAAVQ
ncbi:hypothetical protein V3H18_07975 [Methylocystis sp. 9N]|uniref:Alkaline proteinase inhibitor/ Outer membrane lipoprotein Omp19 domain-containing protein n=1 Tax=Methylocystis borbori TaxID=3118750 RepID=A0ABU7XGE4_9HYPH